MPTIFGTPGNDNLAGTPSDDYIDGQGGADSMSGGAGNDIYVVDDAGDTVNELAGEGDQDRVYAQISYTLTAGSRIEILAAGDFTAGTLPLDLTGNEFSNSIWANAAGNRLDGAAGDDFLFGFGGADGILGGTGDDYMDGGDGDDTIAGGDGLDRLVGGAGNDLLDGGGGFDQLWGGAGDDVFIIDRAGERPFERVGEGFDRVFTSVSYTLNAADEIEVLAAADISSEARIDLTGNNLDNNLWGNAGLNSMRGGGGNDALFGFEADDGLVGEAGNDYLDGGEGADTMEGGAGDDIYIIDNVRDRVFESIGGGADRIYTSVDYELLPFTVSFSSAHVEVLAAASGTASITLTGNEAGNSLWGNDGTNQLNGGAGDDFLFGFSGQDNLSGDGGLDRLDGGDGTDLLDGGAGADSLRGGAGADRFAFNNSLGPSNIDRIEDFETGIDIIVLDNSIFLVLPPGALDPNAFRIGTAAADADDRIIYNPATGVLLYDSDGAGGFEPTQFATIVQPGTSLSASDFTII